MPFCQFGDCDAYIEGNSNYCATHGAYLRKLEREITKPKKVHKIRKESKKMRGDRKTYSQLRKEYLKTHPDCRARLIGCTFKAIDVHHLSGRGSKLNAEDTFMAVCRNCHSILHNKLSAEERRERGLLK